MTAIDNCIEMLCSDVKKIKMAADLLLVAVDIIETLRDQVRELEKEIEEKS